MRGLNVGSLVSRMLFGFIRSCVRLFYVRLCFCWFSLDCLNYVGVEFILLLVSWLIFARIRGGLFFWQTSGGPIRAKPSLQAFRAETMVERFTARMHVSGSNRPFAISARQFVL